MWCVALRHFGCLKHGSLSFWAVCQLLWRRSRQEPNGCTLRLNNTRVFPDRGKSTTQMCYDPQALFLEICLVSGWHLSWRSGEDIERRAPQQMTKNPKNHDSPHAVLVLYAWSLEVFGCRRTLRNLYLGSLRHRIHDLGITGWWENMTTKDEKICTKQTGRICLELLDHLGMSCEGNVT
jgi:hypothetical protein